jgi:hypothetical protein
MLDAARETPTGTAGACLLRNIFWKKDGGACESADVYCVAVAFSPKSL